MGTRAWGITNKDRYLTIDDVPIEQIVTNLLVPSVNRYNELTSLDWRGRFCENSDEQIESFKHIETTRLQTLGTHGIPTAMGEKKGWYQEFTQRWGIAVGYDITFVQSAKSTDYVDKMALAMARDQRTIRYEIIKEALNPQSAGRGFYNQTWDGQSGLSAPPQWGMNTFTGAHNHYLPTGAATLANLDVFATAKQHIREHGENKGSYVCLMNSSDITQIEKLASWVGSNRANIDNTFTNGKFDTGVEDEFDYMGIHWITEDYVPAGYFIMLSGSQKPFRFHEPNNSQFKGLLWMPGLNSNYPWMDSYAFRQFAVRTYRRGAGVVYQITANATYTAPTDYA